MFVLVRLVVVGRGIVRGIGGEGRVLIRVGSAIGSRDGRSQIRREEGADASAAELGGSRGRVRTRARRAADRSGRVFRVGGGRGGGVVAGRLVVSSRERVEDPIQHPERDVARATRGGGGAHGIAHRGEGRREGRRRGLAAATARRDVLDERRAARLVAERHVRERGGRVPSQRRAGRDKRVARARRAPAAGGALTRAGLTRGLHRFLRAAHPERGGRDEEARERARGGCARPTGEPKGHFAKFFSEERKARASSVAWRSRLVAPASVFVLLVQSII